jgi:hypothetical protein
MGIYAFIMAMADDLPFNLRDVQQWVDGATLYHGFHFAS